LPAVALLPLQAPDAVHAVALTEVHVNVLVAPLATVVGDAESVTVGAGVELVTETDALAEAVPPAPVQLSANAASALNAPVFTLPKVAFAPLHAPDAVHAVALVDDHVNVLLAPLLTAVGAADNVTVGAGVEPATAMDALANAVPPAPVQLSVYAALAFNAPVLSLPETAFAPLHPPEAVHAVAFVLDQVNVPEAPALTAAGLADNATVGAGAALAEGSAPPPPPQAVRKLTSASTGNRGIDFMARIIRTRSARR
jgi:hypothetical protein